MAGKNISKRMLYLVVGIGIGFIFSFAFVLIWLFFKGFILGYGDNGPVWVNTVTNWIEIITTAGCAIGSQIIVKYVYQKKSRITSPVRKEQLKIVYLAFSTIAGLFTGLFLGLFVFSSLFRVILDILFGYGDSGPQWVNWVIIFATVIITTTSIWYSNKWTRNYINKK